MNKVNVKIVQNLFLDGYKRTKKKFRFKPIQVQFDYSSTLSKLFLFKAKLKTLAQAQVK